MSMHKSWPAHFKAADDDAGTFEAVVSVFDNVDYAGDRVLPGAFARTLKEWDSSGDPIPIIWSHDWKDVDSHIGKVLEAEERDDADGAPAGLWIKGQLDLHQPRAARVYELLKDRRIKEFSFAYDIKADGWTKLDDGRRVHDLADLDVHEVGPTLKGMNPATSLLGVKQRSMLDPHLVKGSFEEQLERVEAACVEWAHANIDDLAGVSIAATFDDTVLVWCELTEPDTAELWRLDWHTDDTGAVTVKFLQGKTEEPQQAKVEDPNPLIQLLLAELDMLAS